ncbi:RIP metalloprotease RseP [candidate division WOR-3 bacterium]|nr:RIP metalloprotease RseP [candidate division WOR-3 bacterium]
MITSILLVALVIGLLITIHEFGHLIVAKLTRIPVEVFSIGFGPPLLRRTWGGTEYRLAAVPLGGYIKMAGEEEPAAGREEAPREQPAVPGFNEKPLWVKAAVIAAGPVSNLVLGFLLFVFVLAVFGQDYTPATIWAPAGSVAEQAGFQTGDRVQSINGEPVRDFVELDSRLAEHAGTTATLVVLRDGQTIELDYPVPTAYGDPGLPPVVGEVLPGSPAGTAGLVPGDTLLAVDSQPVTTWEEFQQLVTGGEPGPKLIRWSHQGAATEATVEARRDSALDGAPPRIGIRVDDSWLLQQYTTSRVGTVRRRSPAAAAGLRTGDSLVTVAGKEILRWQDYLEADAGLGTDPVEITWYRNNELMSAEVTPRAKPDQFSRERIGMLQARQTRRPGPVAVITRSAERTWSVMFAVFWIVARAVSGDREAREGIGGPVTVAQVTYGAADWGAQLFLSLWALLSVNLFVVNMLPIPVMDGGRILLFVIESARRRRLSSRELSIAMNIGWALVGLILLLVLFNDIVRLIRN